LARIERFSPAGQLIDQLGTRGLQPGEFITPVGIAFDSAGRMLVTDQRRNNVQALEIP
jgi:hypothetical protein